MPGTRTLPPARSLIANSPGLQLAGRPGLGRARRLLLGERVPRVYRTCTARVLPGLRARPAEREPCKPRPNPSAARAQQRGGRALRAPAKPAAARPPLGPQCTSTLPSGYKRRYAPRDASLRLFNQCRLKIITSQPGRQTDAPGSEQALAARPAAQGQAAPKTARATQQSPFIALLQTPALLVPRPPRAGRIPTKRRARRTQTPSPL